ncbi:putative phloem protein [Helianthus annuus]|nr:putative phloem protein [Helianthus annuus]
MKFEEGDCGSGAAATSSSSSAVDSSISFVLLSESEGCMRHILAHTSPRDACRASLISRGVKCFANSDAVWERFLPDDDREIISRALDPVRYSSKKELYFRLCDSHVLLDDGNLSFSLYKQNGKKCFMLGAKALSIAWSATVFWRWRSLPESRFSEVAELVAVCWLEIKGKFKPSMLSSKTTYAAYLVYNIGLLSRGLDFPAKTLVRHVDGTEDADDDDVAMTVAYLKPLNTNTHTERIGGVPRKRTDGWMEIELGKFYNDKTDGEIDIRFTEISELYWKSGLIVEGIDIRPINEEQHT